MHPPATARSYYMVVDIEFNHYSQGFCVNNSVSKNHHNA